MRLIGHQQALDGLSADQVVLDELGNIVGRDVLVPDLLWIHDDRDTALALVETPGVVDPDGLQDSMLLQLGLQPVTDLCAAAHLAAAAWVVAGSFVGADEDMA
ncbi:MAG TPA: hypothetical protein VGD37_14285 [Kofleriaceae bacterium]